MKKVIVTRENYEEVMFNLIENEYETPVREDILAQIEADTFLSFEWKQWSKATYTESLEPYKSQEAEFIESLVKEDKRGIIIPFYKKLYWAAAIALLLGVGIAFYNSDSKPVRDFTDSGSGSQEQVSDKPSPADNSIEQSERIAAIEKKKPEDKKTVTDKNNDIPVENIAISQESNDTVSKIGIQNLVYKPTFDDTVKMMIAQATKVRKPSRYKVSISEGTMDGSVNQNYAFNEKRYTMADVMVHKDGITLSKFLNNSRSRIIKTDTNTYIEYIAEDQSVLILTLAN